VNEDVGGTKVVATPERNIALRLLQYPIASTFGIFDEYVLTVCCCTCADLPFPLFLSTYLLTDPTAEEEVRNRRDLNP